LAKGVDMKRLVAEIWGRATGVSSGKGGDIHLHDVSVNFETGVVLGQLLPVAVGHGLAAVLQGRSEVAVANFGDGAANQGTFHEAANLAGLWKLPVIFLLEDNGYALSVPKSRATSIERYADRAAGYGFPGVTVPPSEPELVYEVMGEAVARARAGEGPTLVEVQIDRIRGGFEGDRQWYRPEEEFELMRERDAVATYQQQLIERGVLSPADVETMTATYTTEVAEAIEFARASPYPSEAEALTHVFAETPRVPTGSEVMA
jgi:pyruvate dehydrogenase E1 component alpha subunit